MTDEAEQAVITKWRDRANAAVRSLVELQERYDQVQAEVAALRPLRAAVLRYGPLVAVLVEALHHEVRSPINARQADWDDEGIRRYLRDRYGIRLGADGAVSADVACWASNERVARALALAAEEGQG